MNSNNRRQTSSSQFAAVFRWVIVAAFCCTVGLSYLYLKNQMYLGGAQKHALENELSDLIRDNNVMASQIIQLTSPTTLQHRLDEGFIKLIPITAQSVVHVRAAETVRLLSDGSRSLSDFHPVSHETGIRR